MEHRVSLKKNARWFLGTIFAAVGGGLVLLGALFLMGKDLRQLGTVYLAVGGSFVVIGMVLAVAEAMKRRQAERLVEAGRFIWGEVAEFVPDWLVRINRKNPYFVIVIYLDAQGKQHRFKSWSLRTDKIPSLIGRKVKVYVSGESFNNYYVDAEGLLTGAEKC